MFYFSWFLFEVNTFLFIFIIFRKSNCHNVLLIKKCSFFDKILKRIDCMDKYARLEEKLNRIYKSIKKDLDNAMYTKKGWEPLYAVSPKTKILVVGQAPGIKAQESNLTWNDLSGDRLRSWLGVGKDLFYNADLFGMLPMDFYYPGKGRSGDLPPRKGFAEKWHPKIIACLPDVKLIILIGQYAQKYYLKDQFLNNSTTTIKAYKSFLPHFFPLIHPSPRNISWFLNNPWFEAQVIQELRSLVETIMGI